MLTLVFWDVQHGNATYIKTPNGRHIVQDLGTGSYGSGGRDFSPLTHLKEKYGVNLLDGVIITHPHRDHIDDIGHFYDLNPRVLYRPRHLSDDEILAAVQDPEREIIEKYLAISRYYSNPVSTETDLTVPTNLGGVGIQIFVSSSLGKSNLNNHSLVTVISYEGMKVVLPGDNESPSWRALLEDNAFKSAIRGTAIFLAPHHGRDQGFCAELFQVIKPRLTIISDGRFGDTSATDRYVRVTEGCRVQSKEGTSTRKVVTTRSDGVIVVQMWRQPDGGSVFSVKTG